MLLIIYMSQPGFFQLHPTQAVVSFRTIDLSITSSILEQSIPMNHSTHWKIVPNKMVFRWFTMVQCYSSLTCHSQDFLPNTLNSRWWLSYLLTTLYGIHILEITKQILVVLMHRLYAWDSSNFTIFFMEESVEVVTTTFNLSNYLIIMFVTLGIIYLNSYLTIC